MALYCIAKIKIQTLPGTAVYDSQVALAVSCYIPDQHRKAGDL